MSRLKKQIHDYFEAEVKGVHVPPPPPVHLNAVRRHHLREHLEEIATAAAFAAAVALLIFTAGQYTQLALNLDRAFETHNIPSEIAGFISKAGEFYRSSLNGG
jgi:hypothetical protein